MNVVHVVAAGEIGGAERMLLDLVRGQPGHSVALFTPNPALRALLHEAQVPLDDRGPLAETPWAFLRRALGAVDVAWLHEVLRRRGAHVAHLHTFASQVLGTRAARAAGVPVLRTEHSSRVYDDPSCRPFSRWSLARVDAVVYVSAHLAEVAAARGDLPRPGAYRGVIHNGVDTEHFAYVAPPAPAPTPARVRFLHLGRLDPRKGIDRAVRALASLPDAELELVGEGSQRSALQALSAELGVRERVHFSGYQADVRAAIARAEVVLSCARSEGLGLALLEAMACGRPVAALPTGGVPEIVHDGVSGWLAADDSPRALLEVMQQAAASAERRRARGVAARAWVLEHASAAAMRAGYAERYAALGTAP